MLINVVYLQRVCTQRLPLGGSDLKWGFRSENLKTSHINFLTKYLRHHCFFLMVFWWAWMSLFERKDFQVWFSLYHWYSKFYAFRSSTKKLLKALLQPLDTCDRQMGPSHRTGLGPGERILDVASWMWDTVRGNAMKSIIWTCRQRIFHGVMFCFSR